MNLKNYISEEDRLLTQLRETDPAGEQYGEILFHIERLCHIAILSIDAIERLGFAEENPVTEEEKPEPTPITPIPVAAEPEPEEEKPEPVAEPEPTPVPTEEAEPAVEFEELKTRFLAAARNGVQVGDIIAAAGYKRLSDVPSNEYGRLLRMLSEA